MKHLTSYLAAVTIVVASMMAVSALSQGAKSTVTLMDTSPSTLATGYRTSMAVGSDVYNESDDRIGKIDDLIVTREDSVPYAVLSVGGFLGMGQHLVAVPASSLAVDNNRMMLRGATKHALKALPAYEYAR